MEYGLPLSIGATAENLSSALWLLLGVDHKPTPPSIRFTRESRFQRAAKGLFR